MAMYGCDSFHYAIMKTEDTLTTPATYDDTTGMTALAGLRKVDIEAASNSQTLFADNGPVLTVTSNGEITVTIETAGIDLETLGKLLGHKYDSEKKTLTYAATDVAPYVAIAFCGQYADGKKTRFYKLFKGRFTDPNENVSTQADSVDIKTPTITGKFVMLSNNKQTRVLSDVDTADAETTETTWFKTVLPTA